jgi:hypothetical protein
MTTDLDNQIRALVGELVRSAPPAPACPPIAAKRRRGTAIAVTAGGIAAAAAALLVILVSLNGSPRTTVSVETPTTQPLTHNPTGRLLRTTVAENCPTSIAGYDGVKNRAGVLNNRLLPRGNPIAGVICLYNGLNTMAGLGLARRIVLSVPDANELAHSINSLLITHREISELQGCPQDTDNNQIIVLGYPGRTDVDLWYHASGCQTLSNGFVSTAEVDDPPFYQMFVPVVAALAR